MAVPIDVGDEDEVKGDMTPMIDIIFLLLVFFILSTKFITPERVISSLLPTDKGQMQSTPTVIEPLEDVNVAIYPDLPHGLQPSEYDRRWKENVVRLREEARLDAGGQSQSIMVNGVRLNSKNDAVSTAELDKVYSYLREQLQRRDEPGVPRAEQPPIVIHCFCGLPWAYAMAAYDSVRRYEKVEGGAVGSGGIISQEEIENMREVDFAPPRIRNYHQWALGNEIWEIMKLK